ncbi:hypothetical protein V1512DRAFT_102582 [Lipomyces arxii]|uniref:uncharacterized protein n=1 Tax=Lipomyces arxii TaxID=56418 RepID=UPI0034CE63A5
MVISAFELQARRLPQQRSSSDDVYQHLLPTSEALSFPPITPKQVTTVALKLKHIIDTIVPLEVKESRITRPDNNTILSTEIIAFAKSTPSQEERPCIVFALMTCYSWYRELSKDELYDAGLNELKMVACETLSKRIIEEEEDQDFLFKQILCRRFTVMLNNGEVTEPRNTLEIAVDLHALTVIGSSGYQKCITWIWHGWIIQSPFNTQEYIAYKNVAAPDFWTHFDPDRIKTPLYQNALQLIFSIVYLALYTGAVNTANPGGSFDAIEGLMFVFTLGFIFDEVTKFYHIGIYYFSFWSIFNDTLYGILLVSFALRITALASPDGSHMREAYDILAYRVLAVCAPLIWSRLLLYLDMQKFFGAMLVVLKELMKESAVFFVLLIIIVIGFLQAFVGLDSADGVYDVGAMSVAYMTRSLLGSPEFEPYENYAAPFAAILNYVFTFVVSVLLLNILIALFNSAYEKVYDNANDEFMALFAQKTLRFVRAPDENVFVPPLNLIEIFGLVLPFEWWMPKYKYAKLNDMVMTVVYSPLLIIISAYELYVAGKILNNRASGESDDDTIQPWDEIESELDVANSEWATGLKGITPRYDREPEMVELNALRNQVSELTKIVKSLRNEIRGGKPGKARSMTKSEVDGETETLTALDSLASSSGTAEGEGDNDKGEMEEETGAESTEHTQDS